MSTHTRPVALALALLLAVVVGAQAQVKTKGPAIKLRGRGRVLVLTVDRRTYRLNLGDKIDAATLENADIVFVSRRADFTYLLVDACGSSKRIPDDRMCGAGTECNLIWLKLTPAWRVAEAQSAHYQSCWSTIENEAFEIKGRMLSLNYDDFHLERKTRLTYDAEQPERGFVLAASPHAPAQPE